MKISEVLQEAAKWQEERIEEEQYYGLGFDGSRELVDVSFYSCHAIRRAQRLTEYDNSPTAELYFLKLFGLGSGYCNSTANLKQLWSLPIPEANELRVWLLAMAAAVAEAEGK